MANQLSKQQLDEALGKLPGWTIESDKLKKEFSFNNFKEAATFIMRLAFEAEALQHHPELFNVYNKVEIGLTTHDAGDKITDKDVELAESIESIYNK
ncbi:MAG TPA: 4a-hydroxytetrahydrobiopterin dehydratase [Balneolales bacterium]|nr:4a-hydroxytetrahydrobiopterin dehydratase [Balneolales bacterium]